MNAKYMSNRKQEEILLGYLAEYVNKVKPINIEEIKGALNFYEFSISKKNPDSTDTNNEECFQSLLLPEFNIVEVEDKPVEQNNNVSNNLPTKKWKQSFVDEVVDDFYAGLEKNRLILRDEKYNDFLSKFGNRIPDYEKISEGQKKSIAYNKYHRTIYNNLIRTGKCHYVNNSYCL